MTEATKTDKSIIDPKYRNKTAPDWLANFITEQTSATREKTVTRPNPENPDEKITTTETVADGIDVDKLFALAEKNGLAAKTGKFEEQRDSHGFPGRFRMTVRNMLQAVAKQRHGLFNIGGTFISAPADWLAAKGAPEKPTHEQDGTKIAPPAKAKAEEAAAE